MQHHVSVHLYEAAERIKCKPRIAALLGQPLYAEIVQAEVENCLHHAGHGDGRTRAHRDEEWIARVAESFSRGLFEASEIQRHLLLEARRHLGVAQEVDAAAAGDRKARRDGHTEVGHLSEVCALAAEDSLHVFRAFGLSAAEEIHVLVHRRRR